MAQHALATTSSSPSWQGLLLLLPPGKGEICLVLPAGTQIRARPGLCTDMSSRGSLFHSTCPQFVGLFNACTKRPPWATFTGHENNVLHL